MLPTNLAQIARNGKGRFSVSAAMGDRVLTFDSLGRFSAAIGQRGDGPGEFRKVVPLVTGPGDSIFAFDAVQRRLSVLSPDGRVVRQFPMRYPPSLVLPGGKFVIAGQVQTIDRSGYPVHLADVAGEIIGSFGIETPQYSPSTRLLTSRIVGPANGNSIWTAPPGRYVLEQWDASTSKQLKVVTIKSTWFRESAKYPDSEYERPVSQIDGIWEDSRGFLWVLFLTADSDWQPPPKIQGRERDITMDDRDRSYDSVIEVIDPAAQRIVASKRFANLHWNRPASDLITSRNMTDSNVIAFDVWRPTIIFKEGKK